MKHEEEADDELTSHSSAPSGWGPPGTKFEDGYFTIPYEWRKIAMAMFKKYDVTACFSGHFHQNVTAQSSWGMPMIVTGPLSMNLHSSIAHELNSFPGIRFLAGAEASQMSIFELPNGGDAVGV